MGFKESPEEEEGNHLLEKALALGTKKAQEIARRQHLKVGDVVAHPSDDFAYELKNIKGNEATVWFPGQPKTVKKFPYDELLDPNVAKEETEKIYKNLTKKRPIDPSSN